MLLEGRRDLPKGPGWRFEIQYDGYRVLSRTGAPRMRTRNGADATTWFPELTAALAKLPQGCILDGEVCVLDDLGRSDFERLHVRALRRRWFSGAAPVVYCVFDMLAGHGADFRAEPLESRQQALATLLAQPPEGLLLVSYVDDGPSLYQRALDLSLEGIVAKRHGSFYQDGVRSADWIKVKRPDAVPPQKFRR